LPGKGFAIGSCASSIEVRALCAHPWNAFGIAIGLALRTRRAAPPWLAKGGALRASPFSAHFAARGRLCGAIATGWALRTHGMPLARKKKFKNPLARGPRI
jgi:hypothetical protein